MRQVLDLVALFEVIPFDHDFPPWDVTLIEGLEGGRAALYFRAHHVVTDGIGGLRLAGALLDGLHRTLVTLVRRGTQNAAPIRACREAIDMAFTEVGIGKQAQPRL